MSWSDDKQLSSGANAIKLKLSKKKKKKNIGQCPINLDRAKPNPFSTKLVIFISKIT